MAMEEKEDLDQTVMKEHNSFHKYQVWKAVTKSKVPKGAKVLTSMWAMKPKLNTHGFEQVDGLHYD
eukprot:11873688-Ditylum_brightwellii.AAC.1